MAQSFAIRSEEFGRRCQDLNAAGHDRPGEVGFDQRLSRSQRSDLARSCVDLDNRRDAESSCVEGHESWRNNNPRLQAVVEGHGRNVTGSSITNHYDKAVWHELVTE